MSNKDIVYIALFASIFAGLGLFPKILVPVISVPITAQSMGAMLCGSILGAKRGALSVLLFIVLVAIGMPLLAGGRGGLAVVTASPFAGYIYGWAVGAFVTGYLTEKFWQKYNLFYGIIFNIIGGIFCVYSLGVLWYSFATEFSFFQALLQNAVFLPGDMIKIVLASFIAVTIKKSYPLIPK